MRDLNVIIRATWIIAILASEGIIVQTFRTAEAATVELPEPIATPPSAEVAEAIQHLNPLWASMQTDIVSCEAEFRKYFRVKPIAPMTRDQVLQLWQRHDLGEHPERTPGFLTESSGPDTPLEVPARHLQIQGDHRRYDLGLLTHVHDAQFGFVYDGDNQQIHVFEHGRIPTGTPGLELFRCPMQSRDTRPPDRVERDGDLLRLITVSAPTSQRGALETTDSIDWATGVLLNRLRKLDGEVVQEVSYSGLTTFAGGITIPRSVLTARYSKGELQTLDLALLDEARLNESIPESVFVVSKPAKWQVLDFREQANGQEIPSPQDEVDDVRTLIPSYAMNPPTQAIAPLAKKGPLSLTKRVLLVLNGLGLIALGVWMWRRASHKELNH